MKATVLILTIVLLLTGTALAQRDKFGGLSWEYDAASAVNVERWKVYTGTSASGPWTILTTIDKVGDHASYEVTIPTTNIPRAIVHFSVTADGGTMIESEHENTTWHDMRDQHPSVFHLMILLLGE